MTNIILALFYFAPGTEVTIINPPKHSGCRGTIVEYNEYKDVVYYNVKLHDCAARQLNNLLETDFSVSGQ